MRLFDLYPYSWFLDECHTYLAEHPDRTSEEILQDLSKLASLIESENEPDSQVQMELIKCRLKRDLLQDLPVFSDDVIECSNVIDGREPVNLNKFLGESLAPLIEFFGSVKAFSFETLQVESVNEENAAALVEFIERLKTLGNLKEIRVSFPSIEHFLNAVEIGLDRFSFVKLSVKIKTFSNDDYDSLAAVLATGIKIDKLNLAEEYIYSSGQSLDKTLAFFASLDSLEVTFSFTAALIACRQLKSLRHITIMLEMLKCLFFCLERPSRLHLIRTIIFFRYWDF